jgi:hypothetical protein
LIVAPQHASRNSSPADLEDEKMHNVRRFVSFQASAEGLKIADGAARMVGQQVEGVLSIEAKTHVVIDWDKMI